MFAATDPEKTNKWIEEIIRDKVRTGLKAGIASIIMKSRDQRNFELGSVNKSSTNISASASFKFFDSASLRKEESLPKQRSPPKPTNRTKKAYHHTNTTSPAGTALINSAYSTTIY